ncbi:RH5 [Odocoileus adenovirus 1]|uniref:RH5 n=1 Tax=Odocoileus adenovirus 1 TaxID=78522 RepID=A0A223PZ66_9ADEN|nr:RH5 [Odocoileus adenovirus 1]ASU50570.1 RH5 [Odocoileus adenovirus 1]ASU50597.1 RH5 [Odocoileus adenovirus 1]ASU50624.1 RH5 [Odocoileus adenovirus 1]WFV29705.1 RH5 [Deer atadenovirus A]
MDLNTLKASFEVHSGHCTKIDCELKWKNHIVAHGILKKSHHLLYFLIPLFKASDGKFILRRKLEATITCYCMVPLSFSCLLNCLSAVCKSDVNMNYVNRNQKESVSHLEAEANLIEAIYQHHDPLANNCLSSSCLFTGSWQLLAMYQNKTHLFILREKTLGCSEHVDHVKCCLRVTNAVRGQCDCKFPFSVECFSKFLSTVCGKINH